MLGEGKCRSERQTLCEPIDLLMPSARCDCRGGNLADLPWRPGVPGPQVAGWRWMALKRVPALVPPSLLHPFPSDSLVWNHSRIPYKMAVKATCDGRAEGTVRPRENV